VANVKDVATYILESKGAMSAMKLQKLAYYSQAWHLVWDDTPLFEDRIEAWANGPVSPVLYNEHRGRFSVEPGTVGGASAALTADERESIDAVLKVYQPRSASELSSLTHRESPWSDARGSMSIGERSNTEITKASMAEYYGSLV